VAVANGTLDIAATVSQVSGSVVTGGSWSVNSTSTIRSTPPSTLDITTTGTLTEIGTAANITLNGLTTTFTNLSGLNTIDQGGSFSLLGGQSFMTRGALTNKGSLTLDPSSVLTVSGSFTQSSSGTLVTELGGNPSLPAIGELVSTAGQVALAGNLDVTATVVPRLGSSFEILANKGNLPIIGTFANLPEGATFTVQVGTQTLTFSITYVSQNGSGSNNVVINLVS
jgi:hypothetical protein